MSVVDDIYNAALDGAIERHFPNLAEREKLRVRLSLKHGMVSECLSDKLQAFPAKDAAGVRRHLDLARRFSQWRPDFGAPNEQLAAQSKLDSELRETFSKMHSDNPSQFQEFLNDLIERAAKRSVQWNAEHSKAFIASSTIMAKAEEAVSTHTSSKLERPLKGAVFLAGVGLMGHGALKAVTAVDEGKDGQQQRNWTKTLLHGAEAAVGTGMTWVSLVESKLPAALRR